MAQSYPPTSAQSTGAVLGQTAEQTAERVQELATEQFGRFERSIRHNPLAAVGIAAGIGLVMALLARR